MSDGSGRDSFGPVPRAPRVKGWIIALSLLGMVGLGVGVTLAMRYVQARATERRDKRAAILTKLEESLRRSQELGAQGERNAELERAEFIAERIESRLTEPHSPSPEDLARAAHGIGSKNPEWGAVRCEETRFVWASWTFDWMSWDETTGAPFAAFVGRRVGSPHDDVLLVPTSHPSSPLFTRAAPTETLAELIRSLPARDPSGRVPAGGRWVVAGSEFERQRTAHHAAMQEVLRGVERVCRPEGAAGAGETREVTEPSAEQPEAEDDR